MKNPFLIGEKIYLRTIDASDLTDAYRNWFNDADVCQYNSHHRFPRYQDEMEEYYRSVIQSKDNLVLAICDKKNDEHIGNISLQGIDLINRSAELAIIIGEKEYWHKGIGYEASRLLISHGFESLNLNRIFCGTTENNIGMQKLAESIGFKREGIARQSMFKDGKYLDGYYYGLVRSEYEK